MENTYTVYMHIFPNKKRYIGITCRKPQYRWNNGKNYRTQELMNRAIEKYGWENIQHEILFENLTKEEAEQKEIEFIKQYKSNQREFGYNIQNGGNCVGTCSEETKLKISKNNARYWKGKKIPKSAVEKRKKSMIGRKMSKESIEKALKTKMERYPSGCVTERSRMLSSIRMKKNNPCIRKKIIQYTKDLTKIKEWNCIRDAAREININETSIVNCAKGRRKSAGGFIWKYVEEVQYDRRRN